MKESIESIKKRFEKAGQGQVFQNWDNLNEAERARLEEDARSIDLGELKNLVDHVMGDEHPEGVSLEGLEPAPYIVHPANGGDAGLWKEAMEIGEEALRAGKVAAFTVAGT